MFDEFILDILSQVNLNEEQEKFVRNLLSDFYNESYDIGYEEGYSIGYDLGQNSRDNDVEDFIFNSYREIDS